MITFAVSTVISVVFLILYPIFPSRIIYDPIVMTMLTIIYGMVLGLIFTVMISLAAIPFIHKYITCQRISIFEISEEIVLIKDKKRNFYVFNTCYNDAKLNEIPILKTEISYGDKENLQSTIFGKPSRILETNRETHNKKLDKWFLVTPDRIIEQKFILLPGDEQKIIEIED